VRIPIIPKVPYLDIVAALNDSGNRMTLFCVNRDTLRDLPTDIKIAGFAGKTRAVARTLSAESIYEKNDEIAPEHISPRDSFLDVASEGFQYTFRHASVTVLELTRR